MGWKNKRVLVTGANGCAGSHLCRELIKAGAKIRALARNGSTSNIEDMKKKLEIVEGDVTNMKDLMQATDGVEIVFHSAAIVPVMKARESPQTTYKVNTIGTFNTAWASMKNGVKRMVHISTGHVYGNQPVNSLPLNENVTPNPVDVYSCSKYAAEIVLRQLMKEGFDVVIARAFSYYGPNQTTDYFVPKVISEILEEKNPMLGNPNPTRDYSYIVDIVEGYMLLAEKGKTGETYNFSSGKETAIGDLCNKILEIAKREFGVKDNINPVWSDHRKLDIDKSCGDSTKARMELGWKPKVGLDEGLRLTIKWWKDRSEMS